MGGLAVTWFGPALLAVAVILCALVAAGERP